jgi:hypothetical protein
MLMARATHENESTEKLTASYVWYVLRDGSDFEKTRLVRNLNVKLALHNRRLVKI